MSGMAWRGAAVVAALVMVAAACADDGTEPISAPSTTERSNSTTTSEATTTTEVATTTTAATTTTIEPAPTTTAPTEPLEPPYWSSACTELVGDADATYSADPALAEFTTLGAEPTLDLALPQVVTSAGPYGSIAWTAPIPGGVLVAVYPPNGFPTADEVIRSASVIAVNVDGSIRWRRCLGEHVGNRRVAVAPASLEPSVAYVLTISGDEPLSVAGIDLTTGADAVVPIVDAEIADLGERGYGSSRFVVLGPRFDGGLIETADRLLLLDTSDGATTEVPIPPSWFGSEGDWAYLIDDDPSDDEVLIVDHTPGPGDSAALFVHGAWTEDETVQREHLPLQVTETFGEPYELQLYDGAGDLVWSVPEFHGISREGFRWAVADDVVIAMRCAEWDATGACTWGGGAPPQEELVGFDIETGEELWTLAGTRAAPVVVGNTAIVTDWDGDTAASSGYVLVDLLTGERIGPEGDPWPAGAFAEGCCGEGETLHVSRTGGIVVATNWDHVRVWYPPELTAPTVTVDLMG